MLGAGGAGRAAAWALHAAGASVAVWNRTPERAGALAAELGVEMVEAPREADIVVNAQALADALGEEGFRIVSGGTENHLMLVDLRTFGVTGKVAQDALDRAGITCNKNAIPNDPEKPFTTSGLRLGTAAVTTAGMKEAEMRTISSLIAEVLRKVDDDNIAEQVKAQAADLCSRFTPYPALA